MRIVAFWFSESLTVVIPTPDQASYLTISSMNSSTRALG
jgi:hypothetical protein